MNSIKLDYRHVVILVSVVIFYGSTLAGLKYYYSPTKSKIISSSAIKKTKKEYSNTGDLKEEKKSNYSINIDHLDFIKPPAHTLIVDSQKDNKKFMGVMKNLGAIVK